MKPLLVSLLVSLVVVVVPSAPALANDIAVPADAPTIQSAIDLALDGDTVLVAPGTYFELIDFSGKAITVRGTGGAADTIIDGQELGSVVTFTSGEGPASVLEGFTIRNGRLFGVNNSIGGAGIFIFEASPTIRENIIRDNTASWNGAGIFAVNSNALVTENEFIANSFFAPVADLAYGLGGGIHVRGGAVEIIENRFVGNFAGDRGGAIFLEDTIGSVARTNLCEGNQGGYGGAVAVDGVSNVTIENLLAIDNTAVGHTSFAGPTFGLGGGIYLGGASSVTIRGATVVANGANSGFGGPGEGGGIYNATTIASLPTLRDSIVRGNVAAGSFPQINPALLVDHSNIEGGLPSGTNNIDTDPLFVTGPFGEYYLSQVAAGQGSDSPCVDAGNPISTALPGTTTRTDEFADTGPIDIGFHFPVIDAPLLRGDCNSDGGTNIADAIFLLGQLFPAPTISLQPILCLDACDGNDDGGLNIADAIAILNSLFGNPPMALPPPTGACGSDPTPDPLGCASSPGC